LILFISQTFFDDLLIIGHKFGDKIVIFCFQGSVKDVFKKTLIKRRYPLDKSSGDVSLREWYNCPFPRSIVQVHRSIGPISQIPATAPIDHIFAYRWKYFFVTISKYHYTRLKTTSTPLSNEELVNIVLYWLQDRVYNFLAKNFFRKFLYNFFMILNEICFAYGNYLIIFSYCFN